MSNQRILSHTNISYVTVIHIICIIIHGPIVHYIVSILSFWWLFFNSVWMAQINSASRMVTCLFSRIGFALLCNMACIVIVCMQHLVYPYANFVFMIAFVNNCFYIYIHRTTTWCTCSVTTWNK